MVVHVRNVNGGKIRSVIVLGAAGATGRACIRHLAGHETRPQVHAFGNDVEQLNDEDQEYCTSIGMGDTSNENDIRRALMYTRANTVVFAIGIGDYRVKKRLRSAQALANILKEKAFQHVRVVAVTFQLQKESQQSNATVGLRRAASLSFRNVLMGSSISGQVDAFRQLPDRVLLVSATNLVENTTRRRDKDIS